MRNTIKIIKIAYLGFPKVIGGNGSWADMVYLTNVKSNGSHNAEYYSTSVTLAVGDEFKIQVAPYASGDYYGAYSTHSSIEDNFDGDGTNNIEVLVAGTYAFYFDSYEHSLYITKVEIAAADEWAQYFLANVGCDSTGANLPTGWSSCATEYAKLSGAAKNIVYGATAKVDGSYVEQAVARYDLAITNHPSLTKFIVNSSDTPRSAVIKTPIISETVSNSNVIMIVLLVSVISLSGVGGYFFFIKKREN